jgi:hypothetical protein
MTTIEDILIILIIILYAFILVEWATRDILPEVYVLLCEDIRKKYRRTCRRVFKRYYDELDAMEAVAKQGKND